MKFRCFSAIFAAYKLPLACNIVGTQISPLKQLFNVSLSYGRFQFKHLSYPIQLLPPPTVRASVYLLVS